MPVQLSEKQHSDLLNKRAKVRHDVSPCEVVFQLESFDTVEAAYLMTPTNGAKNTIHGKMIMRMIENGYTLSKVSYHSKRGQMALFYRAIRTKEELMEGIEQK